MVLSGSGGDRRFYFHRWRSGDAALELAAAGIIWMAAHHLLAGARVVALVPDSVWRLGTCRASRARLPAWPNDTGGAGEIPRRLAHALGWSRRRKWRQQAARLIREERNDSLRSRR